MVSECSVDLRIHAYTFGFIDHRPLKYISGQSPNRFACESSPLDGGRELLTHEEHNHADRLSACVGVRCGKLTTRAQEIPPPHRRELFKRIVLFIRAAGHLFADIHGRGAV